MANAWIVTDRSRAQGSELKVTPVSSRGEATTRRELIDPALKRAGWEVGNPEQVEIEIPVDGFDPAAWRALRTKLKRLGEQGVPCGAPLPKGV